MTQSRHSARRRAQLPGGERQLEVNVRHRGILPGLVNALERSGAGCASKRAGSRQDLVFTGKTVALPPTRVAHVVSPFWKV
jgi:hypothetical protein